MKFYELAQSMRPSYTALVLDPASHGRLLSAFTIPEGWEKLAHHMTINMGSVDKGPAVDMIGQEAKLVVVSLGQDEKVMAVGVDSNIPTTNKIKHITIAVNRQEGGKPFHSGQIENWTPTQPIELSGVVAEVGQDQQIIR